MPLCVGFVLVGKDEAVLLKLVEGLAHLADGIVVRTRLDELVDKLQFLLVEDMQDVTRVVKYLTGDT